MAFQKYPCILAIILFFVLFLQAIPLKYFEFAFDQFLCFRSLESVKLTLGMSCVND